MILFRIFLLIVAFITLGAGQLVFAQSQGDDQRVWEALARPDEFRDKAIYDVTLNMCTNLTTFSGIKIVWQGAKDTLNITIGYSFQEVKGLIKNRGISPELAMVLNSKGYYRALDACYAGDAIQYELFTLNLIVDDYLGRTVASIGTVAYYASGWWILKWLGKVAPPAVKIIGAIGVFQGIKMVWDARKQHQRDAHTLSSLQKISNAAEQQKTSKREDLQKTLGILQASLQLANLSAQDRADIRTQIESISGEIAGATGTH